MRSLAPVLHRAPGGPASAIDRPRLAVSHETFKRQLD